MSLAHFADPAPANRSRSVDATAAFAEAANAAAAVDASAIRSPLTLPVLEDHDDRPRDLSRLFVGRPVLLVFYLGGWNEPCTTALRQLEERRAELSDRGIGLAAVTTDAVGRIAATREKHRLGFLAVHDHGARFAHSLGLSCRISVKARSELRSTGIRLADWTGGNADHLPLAATLLLDADRTVTPFLHETTEGPRGDVARAVAAVLSR